MKNSYFFKFQIIICITGLFLILLAFSPKFGVSSAFADSLDKPTLTIKVKDARVTYGGGLPEFEVDYSGFSFNHNEHDLKGELQFSYDCSEFPNAGKYQISAYGLYLDAYNIVYLEGTLTVEKKRLFIYANNMNLIYGDKLLPYTATFSEFAYQDDINSLNGSLEFSCPADEYPLPGAYAIGVDGLSSINYDIRFEMGTLFVDKLVQTEKIESLTLTYKSATKIELSFINGAEYSKNGGITWQSSNIFEDLKPNSVYKFTARIKENAYYKSGEMYQITEFSTDKSGRTLTLIIIIAIASAAALAALCVFLYYFLKKHKADH